MLLRHYDDELDELELGERVADCLFAEALGALYSELKDRAWSMTLLLYRYMAVQAPEHADAWRPRLDERGMWHLPRGEP